MELVWFALAVIAGVGMMYGATRIEPHWVSRDGERFVCNVQLIGPLGDPQTKYHEARIVVLSDGTLQVDEKRRFRGHATQLWRMDAKSPSPPRGREIYLLRGRDSDGDPITLAVRLPTKSRAIATLDRMLPGAASPNSTAGEVS